MFQAERVRIRTLKIGVPLAIWLVDHPRSRVAAIYASTIQCVGAQDQLWVVTTRDNPGAYRIVADALPRWKVDSIVDFDDNVLHAQGDQMAWNESVSWDPRVTPRELTNAERSAAANHLAASMTGREFPDALGFWDSLVDAWEKREMIETILPRIIGRGPGLTPTGDDFIQALLVTLASGDAHDRYLFQRACESLRPLLSKTTQLSRAFLQEAMQGFSFGALKDLLEALPTVSTTHLTRLVDIGATSGFAYSLGVLFALNYRLPITNN